MTNAPRDPFASPVGALEQLVADRVLAMAPAAVAPFVGRLRAAAHLGLPFDVESMPRRRPLDVRDGVAVLPIRGPIVPHGSAFSAFLGLTAIEGLRATFRDALERDDVAAIVFDVDSPGGRVAGVADFADEILAARGRKPMIAAANDYAFSAAYFLASAADEVFVSQSGAVGSIGTVAVHLDQSGWLANEGLAVTLVASGSKKTLLDTSHPLTAEGRAELEAVVTFHAEQFFDAVARARSGLTAAAVRDLEAGTFDGRHALGVGLADAVGTIDAALERARSLAGGRGGRGAGATLTAERGAETMAETDDEKVIELETKRREAEARAERAETEAAARIDAERARVAAITDLCVIAGCPERVGALVEGGASVDDVRATLVAATQTSDAATSTAHSDVPPQETRTRRPLADVYAERNAAHVAARGGAAV